MDPTDISVFRLAETRLAWVDERQKLLAQNIANVNTPDYKPRDLAPFAAALGRQQLDLAQTAPSHLPASAPPARTRGGRTPHAPDGNAVSLEDQLAKVADTASAQALTVNLYHKYQSLFRIALGRS